MTEENTTTTNTEPNAPNLAEMSDEDVQNFDPSRLEGSELTGENQELSATETETVDDKTDETGGAASEEASTEDNAQAADSTSEDLNLDPGNDSQTEEQHAQTSKDDQTFDKGEDASSETDETTTDTSAEAELARVLAPLKADRKTIRVKTIDELRSLAQMGINYSRKMEEMKPYQQMLKTLDNNDLLEPDKINFLIDLHKKDPAAMKKFFKDSELDPHDLAYEDDIVYTPNDHMVPQAELELDAVISEIRETPSFVRTAKIIQDDWDMASKRILLDNPKAIKTINDHIASGIYDEIDEVMATERALGRLEGLSDLEAYRKIGDAMHAAGQFKSQRQAPASTGTTNQDSAQTSGSESEAERKNRKRAASPTKGSASAGKPMPDFSKMSDEDMRKFDIGSL